MIVQSDSKIDSSLRSQFFNSSGILPLVGIIDTGFSVDDLAIDHAKIYLGSNLIDDNADPWLALGTHNQHGSKVLQILQSAQAQAQALWLGRAVGSGRWAESLVEFVKAVELYGHPKAVVNLSFDLVQVEPGGHVVTRYELTTSERLAIEYARQYGVLLVAAAGNQGGRLSALGQASDEFDNIITVGASEGLSRADYSSYGDGLTLLADGSALGNPSGTSAAAAKVTAAISQIWTVNPQLSYHQVADILKATATNLNAPGWDAETGFGLLNLSAAIHLAASTIPAPHLTLSNLSNRICPVFEPLETKRVMLERPTWFGEDVWDTVVDVGTFPYKKAGDASKYLTDKAGDGLKAAANLVLPDAAGDFLNLLIDTVGEKVQGLVEREIQYIKDFPSRVGRTATDLFSDELWNNFGEWSLKNAINIGELAALPEGAETLFDVIKPNTRPLDDGEKNIARSVFGNSINLDIVRIDESSFSVLLGFLLKSEQPRPFTSFNTINTLLRIDEATLIHELTHVWQYQHGGAIYIPEALAAQQSSGLTGKYPPGINEDDISGYRYGGYTELEKRMAHGGKLSDFTYGENKPNHEQQAKIVEEYYKIRTDGNPDNDKFLPIYAYFVQGVSTRTLNDLIPAPYGLVLGTNSSDQLRGNSRNETLVGLAGDDTIDGGSGNDRMYGGLGNDSYFIDNAQDVIIEYADEGIDQVNSLVNYTLGDNLEHLTLKGTAEINGTGNALNNTIIGNNADNTLLGLDGDDTLEGLGGDDSLEGGAGNDILKGGDGEDFFIGGAGKDIIDGGDGIDTVSYVGSSNSSNLGVSVSLVNHIAFDGIDSLDTLRSIENILGSRFADTLIGNGDANILFSLGGDDILEGNDGDDHLLGGTGNDRLDGGNGSDILDGGSGNDRLLGGAGDDTYIVDSTADTVIESPGTGIDTVMSSVTWDLGRQNPTSPITNTGLDNLTLTGSANNGVGNELNNTINGNNLDNILYGLEGNDSLYGNGGNDRLIGGDGRDILDGGTGSDTLLGGTGDDTYVVDSSTDRIIDSPGTGIETVMSSVTWDLGRQNPTSPLTNTGLDNLTLTGSANNGVGNELNNTINGNELDNILYGLEGNDSLYGNGGNDRLIGGDGRDILDGGTGSDTLLGGTGDDTYAVDSATDRIIDSPGTGIETVIASVNWDLRRQSLNSSITNTGLDHLILIGNANNGVGNSLNNIIKGNELDNILYGLEGDDTLYGNGGNDRLIGGDGNDTLDAGEGNNRISARDGTNTIYAGAGNDIVTVGNGNNNIQVGNGANEITSGNGDNLIYGGIDSDRITTGAGNDSIYAGEGNNYVSAGAGNNVVYSGSGSDLFVLSPGSGMTVITQFDIGRDLLSLTGGLTFAQLSITQGSNSGELFTQISIAGSNDLLARVNGVNASAITAKVFA